MRTGLGLLTSVQKSLPSFMRSKRVTSWIDISRFFCSSESRGKTSCCHHSEPYVSVSTRIRQEAIRVSILQTSSNKYPSRSPGADVDASSPYFLTTSKSARTSATSAHSSSYRSHTLPGPSPLDIAALMSSLRLRRMLSRISSFVIGIPYGSLSPIARSR